ncbi:MAG: hypothetical protein K6D02_07960 [Lachnospiraceae bacterium]|nr:hypothetical protein [Lachnospiraceae bacterium]
MKKKIAIILMGLMIVSQSAVANAASKDTDAILKASDPWANGGRVLCRQIATYGKVSSASIKSVAWVMEYKGSDAQWHYQTPSNKWKRFSPGTSVPTLTGKMYSQCYQRLQLNPEGSGDSGKGGIATGHVNVVVK